MKSFCKISRDPIDVVALRDVVHGPDFGAIVTFEGTIRNRDIEEDVLAIDYECYEEMAQKELSRVLDSASEQWPSARIAAVHRIGRVGAGEVAVVVTAASAHRDEAFLAGRFVIDEIKRRVPIWKKEETEKGSKWK